MMWQFFRYWSFTKKKKRIPTVDGTKYMLQMLIGRKENMVSNG